MHKEMTNQDTKGIFKKKKTCKKGERKMRLRTKELQ